MVKLRDIMSRDVVTVTPETTVRDAMELFAKHHVSGAPVVNGESVVGVVSNTDLLLLAATIPPTPPVAGAPLPAALPGDTEPSFGGPEWNALDDHTVDEAMSTNVVALPKDADATQAAELMRRLGIHRVLVMSGSRMVGIVSAIDVARAVARHRITARRYVFPRGAGDETPPGDADESHEPNGANDWPGGSHAEPA